MYACMDGRMGRWMDGWMHACMYSGMYVAMYVAMYIRIGMFYNCNYCMSNSCVMYTAVDHTCNVQRMKLMGMPFWD